MKPEERYHRFVRWSDEAQCHIDYCPDLYFGGVCHGDQDEATYTVLCAMVRDEIAQRLNNGETLPIQPSARPAILIALQLNC